jgi:hypothetical protein
MAALRLGTLIDRLGKADLAQKEANAELEKAKARRAKIEQELYDRFSKHELDGASGKAFAVKLRRSKNPSLKDWKKLAQYIYRNKALDLFQRRLAKTAWLDRMAANNGKPIPGIVSYDVVKISITKKG